ncbi:hypothetical protein IV500_02355 [Paeniglutamicibacter antarcticus]|uniref:Uncharacterized protein n=1 Tax=Arthrobacter terrae TaxID=2935737 RepID=A0A931CMR3_9MICC|nr:hypothetical protein [Arthrobacter terrae]MBG0738274.1 hypothetical protein [Arthrobacter terrae]
MTAAAEQFRDLCRSSPWKWQSLRFELRFRRAPGFAGTLDRPISQGAVADLLDPAVAAESDRQDPAATAEEEAPVNCWVRRPHALRVEALDGTMLYSTTGINDSKDGLFISGRRKPWLLPAHLVTPVYDDDGLVRRRPEAAYGEPRFGDGRFPALLDPVELAGDRPVPLDYPFANVTEPGPIEQVEHEGRPALESILTANHTYLPTIPGHPLLFPGRTAIRIDAGTGVCVASQSLDGPTAGAGHWLKVLGVDEYMLDDLFVEVSMGLTDVRSHISWDLGPAT